MVHSSHSAPVEPTVRSRDDIDRKPLSDLAAHRKLPTAREGSAFRRLSGWECKIRSMGVGKGSILPLVLVVLGVGENAEETFRIRPAAGAAQQPEAGDL